MSESEQPAEAAAPPPTEEVAPASEETPEAAPPAEAAAPAPADNPPELAAPAPEQPAAPAPESTPAPAPVPETPAETPAPAAPITETVQEVPEQPPAAAAAPAPEPEAPASAKKGKGKKGKGSGAASKKQNRKQMKAIVDGLKQQINDVNKKISGIEKELKELNDGDEFAKKEIDFHALEHDELLRQFSIAQQELQDLETVLANKEREIEEIREVSAAQLKIYQRKVKHLMAANQNEYSNSYLKNEEELFLERQQQQLQQSDPERIANSMRSDSNSLQLNNATLMTNHLLQQNRVFTDLIEEFERQVEAKRAAHDQRVRAMRAQLEEQRERETSEMEQRKNEHIKQLQEKNARAFEQIKRYFSSITHNNLEVIKQSKNKISSKKMEINAIRKEVDELNAQRRKLEAPLNDLIAENERLTKEIEVYKQDKRDLARNKAKIKILEDELRDLQLGQEVLEQRFEQLEQERDGLYDQFETSIHDVRQKTEFRAYVLEQKVKRLHDELEQKEMQLQRVMQEAGLDATAISAKIDDVVAVKNARINQLEVNLAKVSKAHNDILTVYEQKMMKYGIPKEELGFSALPEHASYESP